MEPFSLLAAAGMYLAAEFAKKCGGAVVDAAFNRLKAVVRAKLGYDPTPDDFAPDRLKAAGIEESPEFVELTHAVVTRSPALQRARLILPALHGARALWVDDHPSNNTYECRTLAALGVGVDQVTSTDAALVKLGGNRYDLILSDMARDTPDAGLDMLHRLRKLGVQTPVVFYVGRVDPGKPPPAGAVGITNMPEPLMGMIFDVLERRRV